MMPLWHILSGALFSLISFYFFGETAFNCLVFFLSSWLIIDLDLLFFYFWKTKQLNPLRFWKWYYNHRENRRNLSNVERKSYKNPIRILHSVEFLLVLWVFSLFNPIFFIVLLGFLFHLSLDLVSLYFMHEELHQKISLFYTLAKNKNRKSFI
jgi:hypothetical protein